MIPDFASPPGPDWTIRSHSDVDIVWEHPSGEVQYQFAEGHVPAPVGARPRRVWPALVAMAVPAAYGVFSAVTHLWAIGR